MNKNNLYKLLKNIKKFIARQQNRKYMRCVYFSIQVLCKEGFGGFQLDPYFVLET